MYYERTETVWRSNNAKQVFFNNSTYSLAKLPVEFWTADRMPAAPIPIYDSATHKLVGPQEIGDGTVGYKKELLSLEGIEIAYQLTVPESLTMRQFRVALVRLGKLASFKEKILLLDEEAREIWLVASELRRDDPLLVELGYTDKQIDNFFIQASKLPR